MEEGGKFETMFHPRFHLGLKVSPKVRAIRHVILKIGRANHLQ